MQKTANRLFWDGNSDSFSGEFKVRRLLEYGSFRDVVTYPFDEIQNALKGLKIHLLRTSDARKQMLELLKPYLLDSDTWESAMRKYIKDCLKTG